MLLVGVGPVIIGADVSVSTLMLLVGIGPVIIDADVSVSALMLLVGIGPVYQFPTVFLRTRHNVE